ncbi:hypothetical protein KIN20_001909 [Parelaphostrongylus tenuis]|uniref:Uncharacterized protein n=1 Tax=Parelaphostrongylus tenuis TaxID=148309 RepID=A0AAD5QGG0_PARTN|nr:hypothetical protein KIN20_001909 [Parelaphostrongylus tenuis]
MCKDEATYTLRMSYSLRQDVLSYLYLRERLLPTEKPLCRLERTSPRQMPPSTKS